MSATDTAERPLMAVVNDEIDRLHRSLDLPDSELFCECGGVACKERVSLSREEFSTLRRESRLLIVAAHVNGASTASHDAQERAGDRHGS